MKKLIQALEKGGQSAFVLGGKVLATPFGGRILGLFPTSGKNLLWADELFLNNPAAFFAQDGWLNIGGDRTWIAPELDTNGNPNLPGYKVPNPMDPGGYKVVSSSAGELVMESAMALHFKTADVKAPLRLTKKIRLLSAPPLRVGKDTACAGYELTVSLATDAPLPNGVKPEAWNLLQVPGGGEIHIPVKKKTTPRRFIGKPVFQSLEKEVTANVDTDASFKFCIHADDSRGMMFYLNTNDPAESTLIVRTFSVLPANSYSDVPGDGLNELGYIQQVYIDDGALGGFGELEYHAPYLCAERPSVADVSQLWGFAGPADAMVKLMNELKK
jgi:hypothetical protein